MPIILDHQLREQIQYNEFPVSYYHDELAELPNWSGPIHWHPDFEIATAMHSVLEYQVGQQYIVLEAGDSIWINGNILHRVRQLSGDQPDPVPIILCSAAAIAPEHSTIQQKYIQPIAHCDCLPFIVFRHADRSHHAVLDLIRDTCKHLYEQPPCYEMAVQRNLSAIFQSIFCDFDQFPKAESSRIQIKNQIRLQQMLTYIYEHYAETVTLEDIAGAAHISRSEAGRCFHAYMGCSPVDALIQYRLQTAHRMLSEGTHTLQQISSACGFHSANYFSRKFKETYGYAPSQIGNLGK